MSELNFNGFNKNARIVLNPLLTDGYTNEPVRRHKRKRIQKKWLKRYGYKAAPDENIYVVVDPPRRFITMYPSKRYGCKAAPDENIYAVNDPPRRFIMMHPATFQRFVRAFLGDEEKAVEAIYKYFAGGNKA